MRIPPTKEQLQKALEILRCLDGASYDDAVVILNCARDLLDKVCHLQYEKARSLYPQEQRSGNEEHIDSSSQDTKHTSTSSTPSATTGNNPCQRD